MRRLIALLLSLAVCLAAHGQEPADQDERAVIAILKLGGKVERDEKLPGRPVVEVDLVGKSSITDASLKELKELKSLRRLLLGGTKVTDAGLKDLKELRLRELTLDETKVTAAGLKELKQALPNTKIHGP